MPSALPSGEPAPHDGSLPAAALAELGDGAVSLYLHVPFCATRCGYCDFNTYTAAELGSAPGSSRDAYLAAARAELALAARTLGPRRVDTVFFGGGTPTLLAASELVGLLDAAREQFVFSPGAEVTTECNPESVDEAYLEALVAGGFNRISFGMQSARPHVLRVLERRHTPGRVAQVVRWARAAGFGSVSLDLIYGTPGESAPDWRASLEAALACEPDHVSAYALIVEEGTRLAAQIRRGDVPAVIDDDQAEFYEIAEQTLSAAGLDWYELSNWSRPGHQCRHNLAYWRGAPWWGVGPGAHSHVAGVRWWNVKHPRSYAAALAQGRSPAAARELLDATDRRVERVLLESRLSDGLELEVLTGTEQNRVAGLVERGLVVSGKGRLALTVRGRLLADAVVRDLLA
ncbi:radical SAM family heme chaperone HemW [Micropruina sonneratiae]|uniref:radical SAM family heme chaperone HemW n=1 Tax=Micropruina sonneratiae TaxID=2986940 RepID=UPI002225FFDB|nr:radical SAM family heme chaperone HemW [Micropruina sp. KQZ13P-5]MCW3158423.1 radical SAM family heme chaperone HemW [Micropruina sp. KQZ13P-5]